MKKKNRNIIIGSIIISVLLLAVTVLSSYIFDYYFHYFNPLKMAFLNDFIVVNESGENLWMTPIGMLANRGEYCPIGRYRDNFPPVRYLEPSYDIPIKAGGSIKITYDWDDVNFRHILVRKNSNDIFILDTDKRGTLYSCYPPEKKKYTIPPLKDLLGAPSELFPCVENKCINYSGKKEYHKNQEKHMENSNMSNKDKK